MIKIFKIDSIYIMGYDINRSAIWTKTYYEKNKTKLLEYSKNYQKTHKKPVSAKMRYKPQDIKCYKMDDNKKLTFEKKTIVVYFD